MIRQVNSAYGELIADILNDGDEIVTRNSKVRRLTNRMLTFDSTPLVSVRKTAWRNCLREWEWFMSGSSNIADLHPSVHHWWKPWTNESGNVLFNYSKQFRRFRGEDGTIDQIGQLVSGIRHHPFSRRHVVTTWNPYEMTSPDCAITNCHGTVVQCFVGQDGRLSLTTYQRSVDVVCGLPHNWFQYWAFLMWLGAKTGRKIATMTWIGGDCHVYDVHKTLGESIVEKALLADRPPELKWNGTGQEFKADDFYLEGEYKPLITDKAEMVV